MVRQRSHEGVSNNLWMMIHRYLVDLSEDFTPQCLKMRLVSPQWNKVVIQILEIKKNKNYFKNYPNLNERSPRITSLKEEFQQQLITWQVKLDQFTQNINMKYARYNFLEYQMDNGLRKQYEVLNDILDFIFRPHIKPVYNNLESCKIQDQSSKVIPFKMKRFFKIINIGNQSSWCWIDIGLFRLMTTDQKLDYQQIFRNKKKINQFLKLYQSLFSLDDSREINELFYQLAKDIRLIMEYVHHGLFASFYNDSDLHQQVFKQMLFAKQRAKISIFLHQLDDTQAQTWI
ncbi:UNKNOWN [Stylonychia lemnae]|uniref:Uncharacterized protein n=1 Tax=Stylonychia lemnae TaxID=5949 RepID=A0A078AMH4_STYLE|nr:UNKNOWN [Stylonychia lemnae]|eukprot:CDW82592.1 UNKNOWN [Stylonychia lemnae]